MRRRDAEGALYRRGRGRLLNSLISKRCGRTRKRSIGTALERGGSRFALVLVAGVLSEERRRRRARAMIWSPEQMLGRNCMFCLPLDMCSRLDMCLPGPQNGPAPTRPNSTKLFFPAGPAHVEPSMNGNFWWRSGTGRRLPSARLSAQHCSRGSYSRSLLALNEIAHLPPTVSSSRPVPSHCRKFGR